MKIFQKPVYIFSLFILFFSCKEDDIHINDHKKVENNRITFQEFLLNTKGNKNIEKLSTYFLGKEEGFMMKGEEVGWIIDTTQVNQIVTSERTTYTFGIIEFTDTVQGFRNALVVIDSIDTKSYLLHYPNGFNWDTNTSTSILVQEIDSNIFGKFIEQTCYISVYACQACGSDSCYYAPGWELVQVPCSGGSGGGGWDPGPEPGGGGPGDGTGFEPVGGGSGSGNNETLTPCELGNNLASNPTFKSKMQELKNSAENDNFEKGYLMKPPNSPPSYTLMQGQPNSPEIPLQNYLDSSEDQYSGLIHSHYEGKLSVFTPADLISLYVMWQYGHMISPAQNFVMGMVSENGTTYLLVIEDTNKFFNFFVDLVEEEDPVSLLDNYFAGFPYNIDENATNTHNEESFAKLLKQLNVGLKLMKGYPENFNQWKTVDVNGNVVSINPCP